MPAHRVSLEERGADDPPCDHDPGPAGPRGMAVNRVDRSSGSGHSVFARTAVRPGRVPPVGALVGPSPMGQGPHPWNGPEFHGAPLRGTGLSVGRVAAGGARKEGWQTDVLVQH